MIDGSDARGPLSRRGEPGAVLERRHIWRAVGLMGVTGALRVQLGGPLSRRGEPREVLRRHIRRAVVLMGVTSALMAAAGFAIRKGMEW